MLPCPMLQLRPGNMIEVNGKLLQVLQFDKQALGRQLGNVQVRAPCVPSAAPSLMEVVDGGQTSLVVD